MKNAKNPFEWVKSNEFKLVEPFKKQIFNEENQFTAYYKEITKLQSVV